MNSTLYIFSAACLAYLPPDVRPLVELGVNLIRKGIFGPKNVQSRDEGFYLFLLKKIVINL
ncbi:MAG: hypothetical protein HW387_630 [Parachlamydiales bacterium]|nr:hypothetical protein [Parachlamydiales bacterium]